MNGFRSNVCINMRTFASTKPDLKAPKVNSKLIYHIYYNSIQTVSCEPHACNIYKRHVHVFHADAGNVDNVIKPNILTIASDAFLYLL